MSPGDAALSSTWLVAVCAGRWQVHGIRRAQDAGLRVLALDGDPDAPGLAVAERAMVVDIRDPDAVIAAIRETGITPSGVISFVSDVGLRSAAAVRERLGLPGPGSDLTHRLTDKEAQRRAWDAAGLPNPVWRVVTSLDGLLAGLAEIGPPVIVKPADSAGSRGVTKVDSPSEMETAFTNARAHSPSGRIMVEAFIEGLEYTIETFSIHSAATVLLVTEKVKVPETGGTVAMELRTPGLDDETVRRLGETAVGALTALGYTDGPGHTEIMVRDDGQAFLIEAAGRGAGFMVFDGMVPRASGYDLAQVSAVQAVGGEPPIPSSEGNAVVLRFFPSAPGTVTAISGFSRANRIAGVQAAPFVDVGHQAGRATSDGDRLGYILSWGKNRDQALARAGQAENLISFEVEPCPKPAAE